MPAGTTRAIRTTIAAAFAFALLALPATAGADRTTWVKQGSQSFKVIVQGKPTRADLRAIRSVDFRDSATRRRGAAASAVYACGRLLNPNQSCGNVPNNLSTYNQATYPGAGSVRVCAVSAAANHFYPNGDPRYAWVGRCAQNNAVVYHPYSYAPYWPGYGTGWWANSTVVNASPNRHTVNQYLDGAVCFFQIQC